MPMTSAAGDQQRAMLSEAALQGAVLPGSALWSQLTVVPSTGSTNADLLAAARAGADAGVVLVAEEQTRGRGRLDRSWHSQPGAALTFSMLVRPAMVPPAHRGWLPLLTGVAAAGAIRAECAIDVSLKWPNDVLSGSGIPGETGKLAGILAEQAGDAVVVGIGLNVSQTQAELPSNQATSLALQGAAPIDRSELLAAVLREFERWYLKWTASPAAGSADESGLRPEYLRLCSTIGRNVRVELPGGSAMAGRACDVDTLGRLLVQVDQDMQAVSAGDVVHVR
jgi:BirA family transcriptional regulator, biotin operon repressor / biotin---[acetyl-CoA-carboxylase] ligase